jgi:uncharacterized protein (DUF1697 family)
MPTYIALLRAVNVGGVALKMDRLRAVVESIGMTEVRTVLQSGNLVFASRSRNESALEVELESGLARSTGLTTAVFLRAVPDWSSVIARNPFPQEAATDPARLTVTALKDTPKPAAWAALRSAIVGRERVEGFGRHAYIVWPDGQGQSKLTLALIERKLGTPGTTRNWNTVRRLASIAAGS